MRLRTVSELATGTYLAKAARRFDFPAPASVQPAPTKISCRWKSSRRQQGDGTHQPSAETHLHRSRYAPRKTQNQQYRIQYRIRAIVSSQLPSFIGVARGHQQLAASDCRRSGDRDLGSLAAGRFDAPAPASAQPAPTKSSYRWHCARLPQGSGIHQPASEIHPYSRYAPPADSFSGIRT